MWLTVFQPLSMKTNPIHPKQKGNKNIKNPQNEKKKKKIHLFSDREGNFKRANLKGEETKIKRRK